MSFSFSFFPSLDSDASFASDLSSASSSSGSSSLAHSPSPALHASIAPMTEQEQQQQQQLLLQQHLLKPFPFSRPAALDLSAPPAAIASSSSSSASRAPIGWHNDPTLLEGFCLDAPLVLSSDATTAAAGVASSQQGSRKRKSHESVASDASGDNKKRKKGKSLLSLSPSALSPDSASALASSSAPNASGTTSPLLALLAGSPSWDVALPPQHSTAAPVQASMQAEATSSASSASKEDRRAAKRARAAAKLAKLEASIASLQQQLEHTQAVEAAAHAQAQIMAAHAAAEAQVQVQVQAPVVQSGGMASPLPPLSPLEAALTGTSSLCETASESATPPAVLRTLQPKAQVHSHSQSQVHTPLCAPSFTSAEEVWSMLGAVQSAEHLAQLRAMQTLQSTLMACHSAGLASQLLATAGASMLPMLPLSFPLSAPALAELDAMARAEAELQAQMGDAVNELAAAMLAKQHAHELTRRRAAEAALHAI